MNSNELNEAEENGEWAAGIFLVSLLACWIIAIFAALVWQGGTEFGAPEWAVVGAFLSVPLLVCVISGVSMCVLGSKVNRLKAGEK